MKKSLFFLSTLVMLFTFQDNISGQVVYQTLNMKIAKSNVSEVMNEYWKNIIKPCMQAEIMNQLDDELDMPWVEFPEPDPLVFNSTGFVFFKVDDITITGDYGLVGLSFSFDFKIEGQIATENDTLVLKNVLAACYNQQGNNVISSLINTFITGVGTDTITYNRKIRLVPSLISKTFPGTTHTLSVNIGQLTYDALNINIPITFTFDMYTQSNPGIEKNNFDLESPNEFTLDQNYPNPFNPTTTIKYALKEDVKVSLKIYNSLGQEVRTLVNDHQTAGFKEVMWDGKNNKGSAVPSGVYIYRLVAGSSFVKSNKMMLMK